MTEVGIIERARYLLFLMLVMVVFRFLLEREPNTSILTAFDLPVIERYFPEYEQEMKGSL